MESTSVGWHFILEKKKKPYHTIIKLIIPSLGKLNYFISASTSSRCKMFVRKARITNLEIIIPGPGNNNLSANSPSNVNMCLRRLNSPRLSVLIPSKTSGIPDVASFSQRQVNEETLKWPRKLKKTLENISSEPTCTFMCCWFFLVNRRRLSFSPAWRGRVFLWNYTTRTSFMLGKQGKFGYRYWILLFFSYDSKCLKRSMCYNQVKC